MSRQPLRPAPSRAAPRILGPDSRQVLIRASAGTGKTWQLSSRYLELLRFAPVDRILATTFTRKAAGEILQRVLSRLSDAVLDPQARTQLSTALGPPDLTADECGQMLSELARNLHRVRIGTLDSFNAQLAGSYSLELGFPPGWEIMDPADQAGVQARAVELLLDSSQTSDVSRLMHLLGHGGPGRSVAELIQTTVQDLYAAFQGSSPECWVRPAPTGLLTEESITALLNGMEQVPCEGRMAEALAADCARARDGDWNGFPGKGLAKAIAGDNFTYYKKSIPSELHAPYRQLLRHAAALSVTIWLQQTAATHRLLSEYHQHRLQLQQRDGALSFDDVTRGLATRAAGGSRDFRLDSSISHILLDEFQDTSPAQWGVLRPLVESALRRLDGTFFCVGDAKQAIYGWRGGEAAIFNALERQVPGINVHPLDQSRRSSPVIMDFVNLVMRQLPAHDNFEEAATVLNEWSREFPVHTTVHTNLPGYVCLKTTSQSTSNRRRPDDEEDEDAGADHVRDVAEYVRDLAQQTPQASIGVLTRSNALVGQLIFQLHSLGVPASEEAGNPLDDSAAVRVILALLTLADHPGDTISRFHIAHSPLGDLAEWSSVLGEEGAHRTSLHIRRRLLDHGYAQFVRATARQLSAACNARELRRLAQLIDLAEDYDAAAPGLRAGDFAARIRQARRQEPTDARIRVMNLHQAKGLEFDIVVLPELDSPLVHMSLCRHLSHFPVPGDPPDLVLLSRSREICALAGGEFQAAREQTVGRMLRESLCLLYVGLTRAVHSLHLLLKNCTSAKLPKTSAGLLRAALNLGDQMAPSMVLYERGDPSWFRKVDWSRHGVDEPASSTGAGRQLPAGPPRFATVSARRRLPWLQPSQLHRSRVTGVDSLLAEDNQPALDRGTLFHHWLEQIEWMTDQLPSPAELQRQAGTVLADPQQLARFLQEFLASLRRPEIAVLFHQSAQLEALSSRAAIAGDLFRETAQLRVHNEWRFTRIVGEGVLLNGSIDRLVLLACGDQVLAAEIIDYKTDVIGPDGELLPQRLEAHRQQMQVYRQTVADFLGLDAGIVGVKLAFLGDGRVVEVPRD